MQIADEKTHMVLTYIDALNRSGHRPMQPDVDEYAAAPRHKSPDPAVRSAIGLAAFDFRSAYADLVSSFDVGSETYCKYLQRVGWITDEFEVELTPTGKALLKALNVPVLEDGSEVLQLVLDPQAEFTYARALQALGTVETGLLIDPYLGLDELTSIWQLGNVDRILMNAPRREREKQACAVMAAALSGVAEGAHRVEIRLVEVGLHDRYLIPSQAGQALMLGTSLSGVGKKLSTLTSLDSVTTSILRSHYEGVWQDAKILEPKPMSTQN